MPKKPSFGASFLFISEKGGVTAGHEHEEGIVTGPSKDG